MGKKEVLRSLHESAAHTGRVEACEADLKAFEQLKTDNEDELRRVWYDTYQVASMYAVFQGVIFTAISQTSRLTCSLSWIPASLSIAASFAAFLVIAHKLKSAGEVGEDIKETSSSIDALYNYLEQVREQGSRFDLETIDPRSNYLRDTCASYRSILSCRGVSALLILTFFTTLVTCFSVSTLCRHCSSPCGRT